MPDKKRILIAPCALSDDLTCVTAADIIHEAVLSVDEAADCSIHPLSCGGRGTIEAMQHAFGGKRYSVPALCADDRMHDVPYLLTKDKVAVIEAATILGKEICGLRSPGGTTSYGVGSVAVDAIKNGAQHLVFALGDTLTIDGGCGVTRALGAQFLQKNGQPFTPTGVTLDEICYVDRAKLLPIESVCLCPTDIPLLGDNGVVAHYVQDCSCYSEQMPILTRNLQCLNDMIHPEPVSLEGDGCGGGIAFLLRAMFGSRLYSGPKKMIEMLCNSADVVNSQLIITTLPHLDTKKESDSFFRALHEYAGDMPIAAIGFDCDPSFPAQDYGICRFESLSELPTEHSASKDALFNAAVRLIQSMQ